MSVVLDGKEILIATHEASLLRLRPIFMTALVACIGLLPAAMSTGIGSDSQKPFAIVIVGGLISRLALSIFLAVAHERSFSRAAVKVGRTQPAVSQAVRRLEAELGEQLFDRSTKSGTLTDAGRVLQNYGQRLVRLAEEAESAVRELRDLRRGRVLVGANEAAVHVLLVARMAGTWVAMIDQVYGHFRNQSYQEAQARLDRERTARGL